MRRRSAPSAGGGVQVAGHASVSARAGSWDRGAAKLTKRTGCSTTTRPLAASWVPLVACIRPVQQHWKVAATGSATVLRRGFLVACDYAGTAHSHTACLRARPWVLGQHALERRAAQCLHVSASREASRPFGPNLLVQGDLTGPRTLLKTHRQTIALEEAKARFQQEAKQRSRYPEVLLTCRLCSVARAGQESLKPLTAFLASEDAARFSVVAQGMDRVCRACRAKCPAGQSRQAECGETVHAWCQVVPVTEPGQNHEDSQAQAVWSLEVSKPRDRARLRNQQRDAQSLRRTINAKPSAQPPAKACQQCGNALPKYATPAPGATTAPSRRARAGADTRAREKVHTTPKIAPLGSATGVPPTSAASAVKPCQRRPTQTLGLTAAPSRQARAGVDKPVHARESTVPEPVPTGRATSVTQTRAANAVETCQRQRTQTLGATAALSRHGRAGVTKPVHARESTRQRLPQLDLQPVCRKHVQPTRESTMPEPVPTGRATSVTQTGAVETAHADSWCESWRGRPRRDEYCARSWPGCAASARARQVALPTASAVNEAEPCCAPDGQGQSVGQVVQSVFKAREQTKTSSQITEPTRT